MSHQRIPRFQQGFGIVEIMIALSLGVLIMLGVTQIATSNSQTRWELDRAGQRIDNASYALRLLESDLNNAAFWGEMGTQTLGQVLPPEVRVCPVRRCDPATDATLSDSSCELNWAMRFPLQGGTGAFACNTLESTTPTNTITPKVGTDYLAIRRASSCALGSADCETAGTNFYLQVNAWFDPSSVTDPVPYGIEQAPDLTTLQYKQRDGLTPAPMYRFLNRVYYINHVDGPNPTDQLTVAELVGNKYQQIALVDGVEMLKFEYGLDTVGADGQVDTYQQVVADADWPNVVMVRISLIERNLDPSPGFVDQKDYTVAGEAYTVPADVQHHRRQLYTRTVSVRNVAGRRG